MARQKRNGEGDTITVTGFDPNDAQEMRALAMSKMLAGGRAGRRRTVIIALLDAMYQHYERTGEILSGAEVYNRVLGSTPAASPAPAKQMMLPEDQPLPAPLKAKRSGVRIEKADAKTRAEQIAAATVMSGAGWFD